MSPLLLSDQFGFGIVVCGIGGAEAGPGQFWYLKSNHEEASVGADQLKVSSGDEVLFYLAPDNFPAPNPVELELVAPARAQSGQPFAVQAIQHACVTDPDTFVVNCASTPAAGVTVSGGSAPVDDRRRWHGAGERDERRRSSPPPEVRTSPPRCSRCASTKISASARLCAASGSSAAPRAETIRGTKGADSIRARGGDDTIDARKGGPDRLDCGPGDDVVRIKGSDDDDRINGDCERIRK